MSNDIEKGKAGQVFDDFLNEQGTFEETSERAIKRVRAFQIVGEVRRQGVSKVERVTPLEGHPIADRSTS